MWQDNNETNSSTKSWADANVYCEDLDFANKTDWRLPNQKQLLTIGDKTRNTPAIYEQFNFTNSLEYWTSSTYKDDNAKGWYVNFEDAWSWVEAKTTSTYYVRCVRVAD